MENVPHMQPPNTSEYIGTMTHVYNVIRVMNFMGDGFFFFLLDGNELKVFYEQQICD